MILFWMAVIWSAHQVFGGTAHLPDKPPFMLELLQTTYKFEHRKATSQAGKPLFLTPYILTNQTTEARKAARVNSTKLLGKESYAGYLTVNKEYNANLWFWYIPVSGKPVQETPWILWLQGGPGVSSLYGLFTEIGPFTATQDSVEEIKYSWGKNHSLLFIDNPVGTGFSFTEDELGYATNQTTIGENLYVALQQFLTIFPELRKAPLTIAGESYAGKHIPSLGIQILWNKNKPKYKAKPIKLQGLAIGNGFIDPPTLTGFSDFLREIGLVDDKSADIMKYIEVAIKKCFEKDDTFEALDLRSDLMDYYRSVSDLRTYNFYNYLDDQHHDAIGAEPFVRFVQQDDIRRALHVGDIKFGDIYYVYNRLQADIMRSARPWLEKLLKYYKVMLYNGHLDVIVAYHPSVNTYNALNFTGADEYHNAERHAWFHNGNVAGYYKVGGNLLEVMVRGAGHMVPSDKPSAALGLITAFARGISLDSDTGYLVDDE